jgi:hypothetical protein
VGPRRADMAATQLAAWSIAPAYSALGSGALLLVAAWILLDKLAVRLRWR